MWRVFFIRMILPYLSIQNNQRGDLLLQVPSASAKKWKTGGLARIFPGSAWHKRPLTSRKA